MLNDHRPRIARLLVATLIMAASCSCAAPLPTAPASNATRLGAPARLQLQATPGVGDRGGTARIVATVRDDVTRPIAGQAVTFWTSAGELAATTVTTDALGRASTSLEAPIGVVEVGARVGELVTVSLVAIQPRLSE